MNLEIFNSYCQLTGEVPENVLTLVRQVLTYRNDIDGELGQLFHQMNYAKKIGDRGQIEKIKGKIDYLKKNEWVCWFYNNAFPTGHLNIVKECLRSLGTTYREIDHRKVPTNSLILKWNNTPHSPRYYQTDMITLGLKEGRGVFESAVGTGKSLIAAYILKELSVRSLVIVPSSGLGLQLYNDFASWFGSHQVELIDNKIVRSGRTLAPIRIATIQSLASLQESGDIQKVVGDIDALFVDEIHHAGAASYTNLLPVIGHVYYRFGFTGTFLRNDAKSLDMWGFLSNVLYRYSAAQAIADGYLTPIKTKVHALRGQCHRNYQKEYDLNYGSAELLSELKNELLDLGEETQVLILVKKKDKVGQRIHDFLSVSRIESTWISGDNSSEAINAAIKAFNDKRIRILIGSSVIGEGIDVRSADHLFLCQGGKSEIVVVQAIGRLARLFEGKRVGYLHDFYFMNSKYMKKHAVQRANIIERNFATEVNLAV